MNIEKRGINEINQPGRDFLEVRKSIEDGDTRAKIEAMQEGDYVNMPGKVFKKWISFISTDDEALRKLDELEEIRVEIKEIIKSEDGNCNSIELLVEGGGVCKRIHASLFYNYGFQRVDRDIGIVTGGEGGFNNDPNSQGGFGVG